MSIEVKDPGSFCKTFLEKYLEKGLGCYEACPMA